jgi:NTP pyrophosphatase (non-canonical NTP hydrolase)
MSINGITREDVATFGNYATNPTDVSHGNAMDLYQRMSTKSAIYPGQGTALGLAYVGLKLNGEAGELAEHVGKAMRDDNLIPNGINDDGAHLADLGAKGLTDERRELLIKECGDILWYVSAMCNELGVDLTHVAHVNLLKLCDRGERDALQGSGDER